MRSQSKKPTYFGLRWLSHPFERPLASIARAHEEWLTMRASPRRLAAVSSAGMHSWVRRKWERWLVCICTSQPARNKHAVGGMMLEMWCT